GWEISKEVFDKYFELKKERAKNNKTDSKVEQPINNKKQAAEAQSKQTED
ncbi:transpeptidase, penicillin binding protein, partial [Listeria seeligeri FSL S4-171]